MTTEKSSQPLPRTGQNLASRRLSRRAVPVREVADPKNEELDALKRQLDEKTNELLLTQQQLAKSNLEVQEFNNAMSHDLRAPLRAISGFSEYLKQEYESSLDETANQYIDLIAGGAARMELLVTGMVQYSRVSSKVVPDEVVDLNDLLEDALAALKERIETSGAVVIYDDLPKIRGDYAQLTCLLQNLVENGLKFNESETPTVQIRSEKVNDDFILSVSDNGIGIAEKDLDCVFDICRRLHVQQRFEGVGVGLATSRRIVEHHAGKIWLKSKEGVGTQALISLPNTWVAVSHK